VCATRMLPQGAYGASASSDAQFVPHMNGTRLVLLSLISPIPPYPLLTLALLVQRVAQCTPVHFSNKAAREDLGIDFRELDVTVKEGIESIVDLGFAKLSKK